MKEKIVAIIPARGGSKGLKNKNLKVIEGKSLLGWSIFAAKGSSLVDEVYVSTDSEAIADAALKDGAKVIWRPAEFASDTASSESALLHALEKIGGKQGMPELCVFLQCTSPLTISEDIDGAIKKMIETRSDSLVSVGDFHYFVWKEDENAEAKGINHDHTLPRQRRQDRERQFLENGAIYVFKVPGFMKHKQRFFGKTTIFEMPPERCFEIDNIIDLKNVETLFRETREKATLLALPSEIRALVMDFDGVLTDNKVSVNENGQEFVTCSRGDGWGLAKLKNAGILLKVLSTEKNPVVKARCDKLNIECTHDLGKNKLEALKNYLKKNKLSPENVIFTGNDENDIECMNYVKCAAAPHDAESGALSVANIILEKNGGAGAVRELCELILQKMEM